MHDTSLISQMLSQSSNSYQKASVHICDYKKSPVFINSLVMKTYGTNNISVVSDKKDVFKKFVWPIIEDGTVNCLYFDKHNQISRDMIQKISDKYDVCVLEDKIKFDGTIDQVDIFEYVNMTKDARPLAAALSLYFDEGKKREIAQQVFYAIISYLRNAGHVTTENFRQTFEKLCDHDPNVIRYVSLYNESDNALSFDENDLPEAKSVIATIQSTVLDEIANNTKIPSIFPSVLGQKKSLIIVKTPQLSPLVSNLIFSTIKINKSLGFVTFNSSFDGEYYDRNWLREMLKDEYIYQWINIEFSDNIPEDKKIVLYDKNEWKFQINMKDGNKNLIGKWPLLIINDKLVFDYFKVSVRS